MFESLAVDRKSLRFARNLATTGACLRAVQLAGGGDAIDSERFHSAADAVAVEDVASARSGEAGKCAVVVE